MGGFAQFFDLMERFMKLSLTAALVAASALLGACAPDARQPVTFVPVIASAPAVCDTSIRFVNNSNATVLQLFYNPSSISNWGPDRLGQNVLRPNQTTTVRLANAAPYDFRIVWANGRTSEIRQVNVCRAAQVVVTNAGLRAI